MAEGIMSTVAPPPQEAAPMPPAGMGGPPPVNFKDGGLVRRGDNQPVKMMKEGGDPIATSRSVRRVVPSQKMPIYEGILGDPYSTACKSRKDLTKVPICYLI